MKDVTALTATELAAELRSAANALTAAGHHALAAATERAAVLFAQQETPRTQRSEHRDIAWEISTGGFVPAGHLLDRQDTPLQRLMMRNIGAANGFDRRSDGCWMSLSEWLLTRHGDGSDHAALHQLAEHAIESLPAEMVILRGGCGGETTHACYTLEGYAEAFNAFRKFWGNADWDPEPDWPIVERIPVVKR